MSGMSEDRCTVLREDIKDGTWANPVRNMTDLLAEVDRLRAAVIRANELRRQVEATCERRTAERDEALRQLREMAALVNQCADLEHGKADPS